MEKIEFGENAWTTKDIQKTTGMKKVIEVAKKRLITGGIPQPYYAIIVYDTAAFKDAVKQRNVPMNFLGSFRVDLEYIVENEEATGIKIKVSNLSSIESATRFRMRENPDEPSGPGNTNQPVLYNHERGASSVRLGGNLSCEWNWNEPTR